VLILLTASSGGIAAGDEAEAAATAHPGGALPRPLQLREAEAGAVLGPMVALHLSARAGSPASAGWAHLVRETVGDRLRGLRRERGHGRDGHRDPVCAEPLHGIS
jgi:hypothetical protein